VKYCRFLDCIKAGINGLEHKWTQIRDKRSVLNIFVGIVVVVVVVDDDDDDDDDDGDNDDDDDDEDDDDDNDNVMTNRPRRPRV